MKSRATDRSSQQQTPDDLPASEQRWGSILQKVVDEQQTNDPWYVKLGISLLWSAAIALAMGVVAALILGVRSLLSANVQFSLRSLSDHVFWSAAFLMVAGMFSPSATELDRSRDKKTPRERPQSVQDRRERALERRLRRVYDPWRWRIWGGAGLAFGLAILTGLLGGP
jgi:hypothetical protein